MRTRARVKPSRSSSAMGMVMGIVFVFIGLFVIIPSSSGMGGDSFGTMFGIIWTLAALAAVVISALNTFTERGVAHEVIEAETTGFSTPTAIGVVQETPEQRLAKLEDLRSRQIISDEEYQAQRQRILADI